MPRRTDPTAVPLLKRKLRAMPDEHLLALSIDLLMAVHRPNIHRREAEVILLACQATRRREMEEGA